MSAKIHGLDEYEIRFVFERFQRAARLLGMYEKDPYAWAQAMELAEKFIDASVEAQRKEHGARISAELKAMMSVPEFDQVKDHVDLSGTVSQQWDEVSSALARLPCAERLNESRDIYNCLYWEARLPSGLVVKGSGSDALSAF